MHTTVSLPKVETNPDGIPPEIPHRDVRSFGPHGPVYEVIEPLYLREDGEWMIQVRLVRTGECHAYPYRQYLRDPRPKLC
jgi:hypothetical protein